MGPQDVGVHPGHFLTTAHMQRISMLYNWTPSILATTYSQHVQLISSSDINETKVAILLILLLLLTYSNNNEKTNNNSSVNTQRHTYKA